MMAIIYSILYYVVLIIYIYVIAMVISVVLLDNRNPTKQIAWILCLIFLPIIGIILYFFFGRDYRKPNFFSKKENQKTPLNNTVDYSSERDKLELSNIPYHFHKSVQLLIRNSQSILYPDTKFDLSTYGYDSFNEIFKDIEIAKEHVHIEFYIIEDDEIGNILRKLLIRKAQERVKVRVIYDSLGAFKLSESYKQSLRNGGVEIYPFMPIANKVGFSKINYRNHRKIVVVDGKVGYTGGINIADRYIAGNRLGEWRDTIVRMEGSAVQGLQKVFLTDWYFVSNNLIQSKNYYPIPQAFGKNYTQIVSSGPDTTWESILQGLLAVFSNAKKHIYIHTPYFLPPDSLTMAIQMASLSGVDVKIMLPLKSDTVIATAASSSYFSKILDSGAKIYLYKDNFLHSKAITVDDEIGIVGTANLDNRSFEQNYEVNAFIYDKATSFKLREAFEKDLESCEKVNIDSWKKRKRLTMLKESIARLLSPLL